jgi:hypothetical protein
MKRVRMVLIVGMVAALVAPAGTAWADYVACPSYLPNAVIGTSGDDVINGTAGDDVICGMGGDDLVDGRGGNDRLYGGPGDDTIYGGAGDDQIFGHDGADILHGEDGKDYVKGEGAGSEDSPTAAGDRIYTGAGADSAYGGPGDDYIDTGGTIGTESFPLVALDIAFGGEGNDVLLGSAPVFGSVFYGEEGNDILAPYPVRAHNNQAHAGPGSDVVILANMLMDGAIMGGSPDLPLVATCTVTAPLTNQPKPGEQGQLKCGLPWALPGVGIRGTIDIAVDTEGELTYGGNLMNSLAQLSPEGFSNLSAADEDVCICDPELHPLWFPGDNIW